MKIELNSIVESARHANLFVAIGVLLLLFSSVITIYQGFSIFRNYYTKTLGHKDVLLSAISKLSADVDIAYFEGLLGKAVFINNLGLKNKEFIFVNKYFYVQAIVDSSNKVLAYSVTTRDHNFHPKITLGPWSTRGDSLDVILGVTKFLDLEKLGFGDPEGISSSSGAHSYYYSENYYFGNPGNYQTYLFSLNQSGDYNENDVYPPAIIDTPKITDQKIIDFRKASIINTYTITSPLVGPESFGVSKYEDIMFGPDYFQVRILDK